MENKTKEILIVVTEMNLGGTEKSLLTFLNEIKDRLDLKIRLLLTEPGGLLFEKIPYGVEVEILDDLSEFQRQTKEISAKGIIKLIKRVNLFRAVKAFYYYLKIKLTHKWYIKYNYPDLELQKNNFDIAIAFSGPENFISWLLIEKINAVKKFQWIRTDINKFIKEFDFGHYYYPKFDKIYCVSESAYKVFTERFPTTKSKAAVFTNVISENYILKQSNEGLSFQDDYRGLRILTVGRLSGEKGQQMIPRIVERLKNDGFDFRWYLIGDGYLREELENAIIKLNIKNHLKLLGNQINPYPFFKDCDLYVQTSYFEGYCQTVHEVKIFKKPVVTTDFINASNLIVNGKDGLIVPLDKKSIYFGVRDLIENPQKRKKFSRFLKENKMQKPGAINDLVDSWFDE